MAQVRRLSPEVGSRLHGAVLHLSPEPGELSQWPWVMMTAP